MRREKSGKWEGERYMKWVMVNEKEIEMKREQE